MFLFLMMNLEKRVRELEEENKYLKEIIKVILQELDELRKNIKKNQNLLL